MDDTPVLPISEIHSSYYLRMRVQDRPGVLADIARILSEVGISIGSMFQQPSGEKQADIIFLTHEATAGAIDTPFLRIRQPDFVQSAVPRLRGGTLLRNTKWHRGGLGK